MIDLALAVAIVCVAYLFAEAHTTHRQTCRSRRRQLYTAALVALHRHELAENRRVMGGSGGRR